MSDGILIMGAGGRFGHAAAEAFRDAGWRVKSLVRPGRAAFARARHRSGRDRDARRRGRGGAGLRRRAQRAQSGDHDVAARCAVARLCGHRGGRRQRRHADVSRQRVELRPRHAAGARRNHADASDHAQGQDARRDRAAHPRGLRPRHARDRAARRRLLRLGARLLVRPGGGQGIGEEPRHLSGPRRRGAPLGLCAGPCRNRGAARGAARGFRRVRDIRLSRVTR